MTILKLLKPIGTIISSESCCTISEYSNASESDIVILTFDDGLVSDYKIAFPILKANGLRATFFITTENVGKAGYIDYDQLREMNEAGMEIASHGLTHRYLVTMSRNEALREICKSKEKLEQEIGAEVISFAPVGGHFQNWMTETAFKSRYKAFATMIPGRTYRGKEFLMLRRNHIQAKHDLNYISNLLNGNNRTLLMNWLQYYLLRITKILLGMNRYDRVKEIIINYL